MTYIKDFHSWCKLKEKLEYTKNPPQFNEGEVWLTNAGVNIGYEEDGKGDLFLRPMLVIKKVSRNLFIGIFLSRQIKELPFYFKYNIDSQDVSLILSQIKTTSGKRLVRRIARLSSNEVSFIKDVIKEYLFSSPGLPEE